MAEMTKEMSQAKFDQLRAVLHVLPEALGALMDDTKQPLDGSRAFVERRDGGEVAKSAHVQAGLAIVVAADHMSALERELTDPVMTFAPWTTARGILEASAVAMWLLGDVDLNTRMARSLSLRLRHLKDQETFARDAHRRDPGNAGFIAAIPDIRARFQHLEKRAASLSIPAKRDKRGRLIGFGEGMPSITELADNELGEGGTYRLLSAMAHGRVWANLALGLRHLKQKGEPVVEQHLTVEAAQFLIVKALDWFARPGWAYFKLNGWDLNKLVSILEAAYDQASLVEEARFWRIKPEGHSPVLS